MQKQKNFTAETPRRREFFFVFSPRLGVSAVNFFSRSTFQAFFRLAVAIALLFSSPTLSLAAESVPLDVKPGTSVGLNKLPWRYHPGDDPAWADPNFDDAGWERLTEIAFTAQSAPKSGWSGKGWFRVRVTATAAIAEQPLGLILWHWGASEIFVNGKPVHRYGVVASDGKAEIPYNPQGDPIGFPLSPGENVIAIRYSNLAMASFDAGFGGWLYRSGYRSGPLGRIERLNELLPSHEANVRAATAIWGVFSALFGSFGFLFLLIYLFYRSQRANLYFALHAFSFSANILLEAFREAGHSGPVAYWTLSQATELSSLAIVVTLLCFFFTAFRGAIPKWMPYFAGGYGLIFLIDLALPRAGFVGWLYAAINLSAMVVTSWIFYHAFKNKVDGAKIIGYGGAVFALIPLRNILQTIGYRLPPTVNLFLPQVAILGFLLSISVYLARRMARTNRDLEAKLIEVEHLSAENLERQRREAELRLQQEHERAQRALVEAEKERISQELEEARALQMSMLPASIPQLPHLEIAAYMKTATEVGGDYYDFHVAENGTLTIVVGDATGHGLRAGTMVTATKSLFNNLVELPAPAAILGKKSRALKGLNLRSLYMAMTMLKIDGHHVRLSAAGMPPLLVYRAAAKTVEEIIIGGTPLGGRPFPYREEELDLASGDVLALMSDGFPELFNPADELFDYPRVKRVFEETAHLSPAGIVERFIAAADAWADGRPADDDITFVVIRVK